MGEKNMFEFDKDLLAYIRYYSNAQVKLMLNAELAQTSDDFGTLLHYSALYGNRDITRFLIALGSDVNSLGQDDRTPLMLAIRSGQSEVVDILLEADANIYIIDAKGQSSLQLAFESENSGYFIVQKFIHKLKSENRTNEELAERFIAGGCNMYHTAALKDVDLMKCMLERKVDIDSRSSSKKTALHVAANQGDIKMTIWLLNNGADVNAVDTEGKSALLISASNGNKDLVTILLDRGADPNCKDHVFGCTPLAAVFINTGSEEEFVECAEIVLQHGAVPQDFVISDRTIFDFALYWSSEKRIKTLIGHLAMLEVLGMANTKSVMYVKEEFHQPKMSKFENVEDFYEHCLEALKIVVFEDLSLFDLLQVKEHKMRLLVRKETFVFDVEKACSKNNLKELYSYYYNTVTKRIGKANRLVELEDQGIAVICKLFKSHYSQCYNFARQVVGYLSECGLKQLTQVT